MRLTAHALLFSCLCASVVVADDYEIILDSYNELELVAGLGQQEDVNGWLPAIEGANALQVELSNTHMTMADAAGNLYLVDKESHAVLKMTRTARCILSSVLIWPEMAATLRNWARVWP